jgi:hypothetical protein
MNIMNAVNTQTNFKFSLDTSGKKIICPSCGHRRAVRYKNNETGEFFPDIVSRCDRENNCGYHYTPKQYLRDIGAGYVPGIIKKDEGLVEQKIDYMPLDYVEQSMSGFDKTNFAVYLISLFGPDVAKKALIKYLVGRSRNDNGKACIFWRIDKDENVRTGKIMVYNPNTGKRSKEINPTWVHTRLQGFNYHLCFYGEHLISKYPDATIGIVESEKTAIIASIFMKDMIWLATGGNSGCKWREYSVYKVLKNRNVIMFPDFGFFNKKTQKTCFDEWAERTNHIRERLNCSIKVSRFLEDNIPSEERINDYDLADLLIKQCTSTGFALSDYEYPVFWDL